MSYLFLKLIIFSLITLKYFCYGCLRTPTVESSPTIVTTTMVITTTTTAPTTNPCANSFTTDPFIMIVSEAPDGSGIFMVEVTCQPFQTFLLVNNMDFVSFPQTFSCDAATGKYIFIPGSGIPTPINMLGCS